MTEDHHATKKTGQIPDWAKKFAEMNQIKVDTELPEVVVTEGASSDA